jgi:hypothetical protein
MVAAIVTLLRKLAAFPHPVTVADVWPVLKPGEKALLLVASAAIPLAVIALVVGAAISALVPAIRHSVEFLMQAALFLLMLTLAAGLFLLAAKTRSSAATSERPEREAAGVERQAAWAAGSRPVQIILALSVAYLIFGVLTRDTSPYALTGLLPVAVFWILWRRARKVPSVPRPLQSGFNDDKLKALVLILCGFGALLSALVSLSVLLEHIGGR